MYLNDVGYRIWPGNYGKFMVQLNASASSVGRWRVGPRDQGYGRFARALEQRSGRTSIRVSLEPGFAAAHRAPTASTSAEGGGSLNVTVRVVYLDEGRGRWQASLFPARLRSACAQFALLGLARCCVPVLVLAALVPARGRGARGGHDSRARRLRAVASGPGRCCDGAHRRSARPRKGSLHLLL
jgi:hypothetical protein